MLKILIMMFVTVAVMGGNPTKNLSMINNVNNAIEKSQDTSIKENAVSDVPVNSSNTYKSNARKNLNPSSSVKNSSENSQYNNNNTTNNKQERINSNSEKPNNSINEQTNISSNNETNEQINSNSQVKDINSDVNTENQINTNVTSETKIPTIHYDRTTSIYEDDKITLLRVEYYLNNKLTYYSEIEQFDATTKSYIEKIYKCNLETNIDPLIRTDVYVNGKLTRSY